MLKLGENLKKYRTDRLLTQEGLADILGVSAQAVSRWENGTTYPDITLLPTIASYFEITLDELMGMQDFKSEEKIKTLLCEIDKNSNKGAIYENILILREAVKTYPTNYQLQFKLLHQLSFCQYKNGQGLSEEEEIKLNSEACEVGNHILSRCNDGKIINRTTQQLCYIYSRLGETEKAVEYAKRLPDIGACSTVILGDIYEGEERKKHLQNAVKYYTSVFWCNLRNMADLEFKDKSQTNAQRIAILKKALELLALVFEDGDYLNFCDSVSVTHRYIATLAMLENDYELALSSLEKSAEYAIMSDTLPDKKAHTSLLVNEIEYTSADMIKNYAFTNCKVLYDKLQQSSYDAIRDNKRFEAILEKIKPFF